MVGCVLLQIITQKAPDRERVRATLRYAPVAGDLLEESDDLHLEIDLRINRRTPA